MEKKTSWLKLLLFSSFFLNTVFCSYIFLLHSKTEPKLGWSRKAATEAEAVAAVSCSGHGRAFLDGILINGVPQCECNSCYGGVECSELLSNCSANVDGGDPLFLEPYWRQQAENSAVVISGWHRMSYSTTSDNFISIQLEKHIRRLHKAVGNAVTDDRFIIFGTGATQLLNAVVNALSLPDNNNASSSPASVVASIPYYPMYKKQTDLFDSRLYEWKGITSDWKNVSDENFIEFVTSPNNPDGRLQHSVLGSSSVIYDHCYYWPHYSAIPEPMDGDIMLFSNSKITGHAGSRFGWAVIKDEKVYQKVATYMTLNTMGVSRDTQLRILKLLKAVLVEIGQKRDVFEFGYKTMTERWQRLNKIISPSRRFSLQQLSPQYCTYFQNIKQPSPAYGWLKCEMVEDRDCEAILKDAGIITRGGANFQADSHYTRLSLIKEQDNFELLLRKMEALIAKEKLISYKIS